MPTVIDWIKKAASKRSIDNRPGVATSPDAAPAAANDVAQRYANLGELARGGMGAIVKVYDREIRRELVMKVFDPADGKVDPGRVGLFVEEAQITGQLDHPNICPVHDVGADSAGTRFFTMKIVRGKTLAEIIHAPDYDPTDPRKLHDTIEVVLKVCNALAFAHAKGVLHRDMKPENIMVGDFGQVYLMDWGVAKLLPMSRTDTPVTLSRTGPSAFDEAGSIVGTLMYMAPEQARGEADLDERADVFGLGAILYEILTQVPPYYALDVGSLVLQAQSASWRAPQELCGQDMRLSSALCAICEKAMSPDRADRYASVSALKEALDEFLVGGLSFPSRTFAPGECIVTEGEEGDTAFILQRGYCRVYKLLNGEMVGLADLKPGDVFGETSVFASTQRTATVQALTDVTVQVVSRDVFEKDMGLASAVGTFVTALAERFVDTDRELRALKESALQTAVAQGATPTPVAAPTPAPTPAPPTPEQLVLSATAANSPMRLVEAAIALQAMAGPNAPVSDLYLEALVLGAQELARRRARSTTTSSPSSSSTPS